MASLDLPRARQEAQHVARSCAAAPRPSPGPSTAPGAYSIASGCSVPGTSMTGQPARNADTGAVSSVADMIEDAEIVARHPRLFRKREPEVGVHAALVKLIDDERGDIAQQRILLQVRGQDAFGDDEQPRVLRESGARNGCASRSRGQRSSRARRRCVAPWRARPRGAAAATARGRDRSAPAARAWSCRRPARRSARRRDGDRAPRERRRYANQRAAAAAHRSIITAYRQGYSSACAPAYWRATARRVEKHPGT